ncbi:MAG: aminoacyl-tRNA hydrolase [Coriobacteriales bacterium]|nr:aminoacyl-tRNA hydrolase [Coriobacteriales bacterium]
MNFFDNIKSQLGGGTPTAGAQRCQLVVGLGNPGLRYSATRHNAGFLALDKLASEFNADNWRPRFDSLVAEKKIELAGEATLVVLAKPQTMMNRSGRAVKGLLKHYGLKLQDLCVIHDDIDLPVGQIRIKSGGGHGGHNGIRDIAAAIGADFTRIKIGVGGPPGRMDSADYVLQLLKGDSLEELLVDAAHAGEAARYLLEHSLVEAQNRYN